MVQVVLASRNHHKLEEIRRMRPDIHWLPMPAELPDPPETGSTFIENALQKATFVFAATGLPCLADDSGLEVDFLGGKPGVHSKRYSDAGTDAANNAKLLAALAGQSQRGARYRCVLALVGPNGIATVSGSCEGEIGQQERGSGGFGYDPLFFATATPGKTVAELTAAEKDAISHRGAAMGRLNELFRAAGMAI